MKANQIQPYIAILCECFVQQQRGQYAICTSVTPHQQRQKKSTENQFSMSDFSMDLFYWLCCGAAIVQIPNCLVSYWMRFVKSSAGFTSARTLDQAKILGPLCQNQNVQPVQVSRGVKSGGKVLGGRGETNQCNFTIATKINISSFECFGSD